MLVVGSKEGSALFDEPELSPEESDPELLEDFGLICGVGCGSDFAGAPFPPP